MSSDVRIIYTGAVANDGTGDAIRTAFTAVNENFANIDTRISTGNYGIVYSGTDIQANLRLISKNITRLEGNLEVYSFANIAGNTRIANLNVNNTFVSTTITSTGNTNAVGGLTVTGPAHFKNNMVIVGNLTVLGNSTSVSSSDLAVQDSIINLHTLANLAPLTVDDGKDIGIKFHYYKGEDRHAALVWANDTQALEFYANGIETVANTFSGTYGNVKVGSVWAHNTTQATSTTTGSLNTRGGLGVGGNAYIGGNLVVSANTYLQTANVKQLTVSEQVVGSLYFTGNDTIFINGSQVVTSAGTFLGGPVPNYTVIGKNPVSGTDTGAVLETKGNLFANSRVASTSTTTGALVVNGGAGISGDVWAGSLQGTAIGGTSNSSAYFTTVQATSTIKSEGNIVAASGADSSSATTGALVVKGGVGMSGNLVVGGSINNTSIGVYGAAVGKFTTIDTSSTLTVTGITKLNSNTVINSGTASGNISTGALVVNGGVGISGDVNIGGNISTSSAVTTNFSTGNARITGGSITGANGQFTTLTATNFSTANAVSITGASIGTAVVTNFTSANAHITSSASGIGISDSNVVDRVGNVYATTTNTTNFSSANVVITGGTATTFAVTNFSSGNVLVSGNIVPNANATVNLGSSTNWFNNIYGVSSQAKYADLAENYLPDNNGPYGAGSVVVFGGDAEITTTTVFADTRVAGAISTNPAYLMNADFYQGQPVALRGRIPVNVVGKVKKGDLLVTSNVAGYATSVGSDKKYGLAVFAKSLNNKDDDEPGQIEAVIL